MDDKAIRKKIDDAIRIVEDVDPAFRNEAFAEVLRFFLTSEETGRVSSPSTILTTGETERVLSPSTDQSLYVVPPDPILFLREKKVTSHSDRVLVMSYFLEKYDKKDGFSVGEMKEMFVRCRVAEPVNLFDIISKQVKKRLLRIKEEKEGVKIYVLTLEGMEYVDRLPHENR